MERYSILSDDIRGYWVCDNGEKLIHMDSYLDCETYIKLLERYNELEEKYEILDRAIGYDF
jgi:hypothetical protein